MNVPGRDTAEREVRGGRDGTTNMAT